MNGIEEIEEIINEEMETEDSEQGCLNNVHSQTWHDSWRNSH